MWHRCFTQSNLHVEVALIECHSDFTDLPDLTLSTLASIQQNVPWGELARVILELSLRERIGVGAKRLGTLETAGNCIQSPSYRYQQHYYININFRVTLLGIQGNRNDPKCV